MNIKMISTCAAIALTASACTTMNDDMNDGMDNSTQTSRTTTMDKGDMKPATTKPMKIMVGGAEMFPNRTIVQNAMNSPIHTTLVKAVTAAGLAETLSGPGPFTVFAPTNDAFSRVPAAAMANLLKPEMKPVLARVLKHHVVSGRVTAADLVRMINAGGGSAMVTTLAGDTLTATLVNGDVKLSGDDGSIAYVTQADVMQSNGIIHVVNGVLSPRSPTN